MSDRFVNEFTWDKLKEFQANREVDLDFKKVNTDGEGYWLVENITHDKKKRFDTFQEVKTFLCDLKGKTAIMQEDIVGFILIEDGKVIGFDTEYGHNDDYVREHWLGMKMEPEGENSRYSIYDVYSPSELGVFVKY